VIVLPDNFDGAAFKTAFSLGDDDYWARPIGGGQYELVVPSLPDLTQAEVDVFVVDLVRYDRIQARRDTAKTDAKAVPNFATQDAAWFQNWFDTHLSDAIIDGIADFAGLKVVLKDIVIVLIGLTKFMLAVRNKQWPDLPED